METPSSYNSVLAVCIRRRRTLSENSKKIQSTGQQYVLRGTYNSSDVSGRETDVEAVRGDPAFAIYSSPKQ